MKLYFLIGLLYARLLAMSNRTSTVFTGDGTGHDADGPFMTSGGQLMTEEDI